jgi:cyanophycinase
VIRIEDSEGRVDVSERLPAILVVSFVLLLALGCAPQATDGQGGEPAESEGSAPEAPPWEGGSLVIIGGGSRPLYVMEKIVELAGGPECRMVVIPMASAEPEDTGDYQSGQLREAGCPEVDYVIFDRASADTDEIVARLDDVTGIFFSGGVQSRLMGHMEGSRLFDRVREIYLGGGVLGGTSAGAAVMSQMMITGDENRPLSEDDSFEVISSGNIVTTEGFGFVTRAIIDQHFVVRKRHNRLISLVLENPELVGIGIDESTAIVMPSPDEMWVLGESIAVVYDASEAANISANEEFELSASNIRMHLLGSGQGYDLARREVIVR